MNDLHFKMFRILLKFPHYPKIKKKINHKTVIRWRTFPTEFLKRSLSMKREIEMHIENISVHRKKNHNRLEVTVLNLVIRSN
jgi:hypothetical protein